MTQPNTYRLLRQLRALSESQSRTETTDDYLSLLVARRVRSELFAYLEQEVFAEGTATRQDLEGLIAQTVEREVERQLAEREAALRNELMRLLEERLAQARAPAAQPIAVPKSPRPRPKKERPKPAPQHIDALQQMLQEVVPDRPAHYHDLPPLDFSSYPEKIYCSSIQEGVFYQTYAEYDPNLTIFEITVARDHRRGSLSLVDDHAVRARLFNDIHSNLRATCELLGVGTPKPGQVTLTPGRVVKSGEYWEIEHKIILAW
jgi:hypothetical protein